MMEFRKSKLLDALLLASFGKLSPSTGNLRAISFNTETFFDSHTLWIFF